MYCFCLVLLFIWGQFSNPQGGLYLEGQFNRGFFVLPVWGAYIWRGLYMGGLINGILRYFLTNLPLSCIPRWLPDFIMETAIFNASHSSVPQIPHKHSSQSYYFCVLSIPFNNITSFNTNTEIYSLQSKQLDLGFLKFLKTGLQSHNSSGSQILFTLKLHQDGAHKGYYYILNTNDKPGELSHENLISSHAKITCYLHMWKYHLCYGYIINRTFHIKKLLKWNGFVFHWCLIIKRTLHGHLEIRNFSSLLHSLMKYFSTLEEKFSISARPCNVL